MKRQASRSESLCNVGLYATAPNRPQKSQLLQNTKCLTLIGILRAVLTFAGVGAEVGTCRWDSVYPGGSSGAQPHTPNSALKHNPRCRRSTLSTRNLTKSAFSARLRFLRCRFNPTTAPAAGPSSGAVHAPERPSTPVQLTPTAPPCIDVCCLEQHSLRGPDGCMCSELATPQENPNTIPVELHLDAHTTHCSSRTTAASSMSQP